VPDRRMDPLSSVGQQSAVRIQHSLGVGAIVNGKERRHPLSQKIDSVHTKCGTADNCRETVINNSGNAEGRPESGSHGRSTATVHATPPTAMDSATRIVPPRRPSAKSAKPCIVRRYLPGATEKRSTFSVTGPSTASTR